MLSLTRLDHLGPVDLASMQVTAGAGVTLSRWRAHAHEAGLDAPVDFAARDTATVGGAMATNAGGSRVLRFGTMRQQVVGVEAVLASGDVVGSLAGLPKETAGMHWPSLVVGSEGTLAVVTAARLRLVPRFEHTVTAMVSMSTDGRRGRPRRASPSIASRRSTPSSSSNPPRSTSSPIISVAVHRWRFRPVEPAWSSTAPIMTIRRVSSPDPSGHRAAWSTWWSRTTPHSDVH